MLKLRGGKSADEKAKLVIAASPLAGCTDWAMQIPAARVPWRQAVQAKKAVHAAQLGVQGVHGGWYAVVVGKVAGPR